MSLDAQPLFAATGLTKRYAVTVLDSVDFDLRQGEIHALIGANGAGKTTLSKIIAGLTPKSSGTMKFDGQAYCPKTKKSAEAVGIQIVQQELNLVASLSVAENLMLSRMPHRFGVINRSQLHQQARVALDRFGLKDIQTDTVTRSLGVGQRQMVEIAAALDRQCRILILDEPTAALSANETQALFNWLGRLRTQGVGMIYISHRLDEVSQMADRITVLRDGKKVATHDAADLTTDAMVDLMSSEASLTREFNTKKTRKSRQENQAALKVDALSRGRFVRDVSFTLKKGERLGVAGVVGSGRTELLRCLFGADIADSGSVQLAGSDVTTPPRHPYEAVARRMAMVTEDRKESGLLLSQPVRVNATLASMREKLSAAGIILFGKERRLAAEQCEAMETRYTSIEQSVGTLSGGNQQKVVIAKWLMRDADVFLFDEPTRGIDVAARIRIYRLFDALTDAGKSLIIVSSDLEELYEVCDRIAVMSNGQMVTSYERNEWSEDKIMQAAFSEYVKKEAT
ncbi:Ribose import ATP-binding protein RbsA [Planctomycetes bacterium CA13]|uniref:Ribose import ATP-binding protein RbsA n=1 Tax=Novipirellula herctigrandis TaxID=2527986 RepID=A0A5C5ZCU3_9BACT|nr:Ribose import ATP-binding protein RbsA [Planctomycetes bacterium CA13]